MNLLKTTSLILFCLISATTAWEAQAVPVRADGGKCDSTGTARKDGRDDKGNKLNCKWDTCTYTKCSTKGGKVSNCVKKTEYSNARDCKAAAGRGFNTGRLKHNSSGKMSRPSHRSKFRFNKNRIRNRIKGRFKN